MKFAGFVLTAAALSLPLIASATPIAPFGVASAYNLFAVGTVDAQGHTLIAGTINDSADVTGRIAAADKILSASTIGSTLFNDPYGVQAPFDFVSPNGLNGGSYNINSHGNAFAPGSNGNFNFNGGGHRVTTGTSGINFAAVRTALDAQTTYLGTLATTGQVIGTNSGLGNPSWFVLKGTSATLNVFNITAAQFANNQLDIVAPTGSTIIVNVLTAASQSYNATVNQVVLYNGNQNFSSETNNKILFNFPNAQTVHVNSELAASVLAPFAILSGGSDLDGNVIAAAIGQTGEVHNIEFEGTLPTAPVAPPAVPEPGTLMLVGTGMASVGGAVRRRLKA